MTMDRSTITQAITDLDDELALLTRRRQLLEDVLATYDGPGLATALVVAPAPAAPKSKTAAKPKSKTAAAAQRKWDFQEIARVVDEALFDGKNPRLVLISRYEVNDAMSYYLMKQVKKLRNPVHLPKPPVDTGRFTPDDALAAIEGSAAA